MKLLGLNILTDGELEHIRHYGIKDYLKANYTNREKYIFLNGFFLSTKDYVIRNGLVYYKARIDNNKIKEYETK